MANIILFIKKLEKVQNTNRYQRYTQLKSHCLQQKAKANKTSEDIQTTISLKIHKKLMSKT
jgi:hypothetical protein